MKKVILCAIILAVHGVLLNSVLAQDMERRYLVTYWSYRTNGNTQSATVVTVVNQTQSGRTCNVHVGWFSSIGQLTDDPVGDSGPRAVTPGAAVHFCSRNVPDTTIISCSDGGVSKPPLTGITGTGTVVNQG